MTKKGNQSIILIFLRYLLLLIVALFVISSTLFYSLFLKLTIYPVNFLLNFFYNSEVFGDTILINGFQISIIPACVAVSAYLLLLILNLTTPIKLEKRIKLILLSFLELLGINILRIFILSILLI